jgi:hypothetical protein
MLHPGYRPHLQDLAPALLGPTLQINARIKQEAMSRGLMVYSMGGAIDGRRGDHVLLARLYRRSSRHRMHRRPARDTIDAAIAGAK